MKYSLEAIMPLYGSGKNYPSQQQWQSLLSGDLNSPLTVVNFFKLRAVADTNIISENLSGEEAFNKYAETSVPKVAELGGRFLLRGGVEGGFIGENLEQWHITAIGQYPRRENFIQLLMDDDYKEAFKYRQAALETQHVYFVNEM